MASVRSILVASLAGAILATVPVALGETPDVQRQLAKVKRATARFHAVDVARRAGYRPVGPCAEEPGRGAMGYHYANDELVADPALDVLSPEALLYERGRAGRLRLVGVEYIRFDADQDLDTDFDRPELFGRPFDGPMLGHEPGMPIHYDLHAWVWRRNPSGTFAQFNPLVRCPLTTPSRAAARLSSGAIRDMQDRAIDTETRGERPMHTETLIHPSAGDDVTASMPTICAAFQATVARHPSRVALRLPEASRPPRPWARMGADARGLLRCRKDQLRGPGARTYSHAPVTRRRILERSGELAAGLAGAPDQEPPADVTLARSPVPAA